MIEVYESKDKNGFGFYRGLKRRHKRYPGNN